MKLSCKRDGLLLACQLVSVATAGRTTNPVLSNNKIKAIADVDRLTLVATDLEVGIRYEVRGLEIEEAGEAIFPVMQLISILRESQEEDVRIETDDSHSVLTTATAEFEMPNEDPASFPDFATFEGQSYCELSAGDLRRMIRQTIFAAAKEDTKYTITGVLWEVDPERTRLVATDTRRLALAEGPGTLHGEQDTGGQSHLVPTKAMELLERNLNDDGEQIRVCLRLNDILIRLDKATIYSRLVEGRYPPYRDIIPKQASARIVLPAERFLAAVRQAAIMVDEESKRVQLTFGDQRVTLEAQGPARGRSKVALPLDYTGEPISIGFDPHYLIDMFRRLEENAEVTLELIDGTKPALFRVGKHYLYLVMPLTS